MKQGFYIGLPFFRAPPRMVGVPSGFTYIQQSGVPTQANDNAPSCMLLLGNGFLGFNGLVENLWIITFDPGGRQQPREGRSRNLSVC